MEKQISGQERVDVVATSPAAEMLDCVSEDGIMKIMKFSLVLLKEIGSTNRIIQNTAITTQAIRKQT